MTTMNEARQAIESSFENVPYPGDTNIGLTQYPEGQRATEIFMGQHWNNLSLDRLGGEYLGPILSTLTSQAFHFFLPGLLLFSMDNLRDEELLGVILFAITPDDPTSFKLLPEPVRRACMDGESYKTKKLGMFSPQQKKAILACLTYMREQFSGYEHVPLQRACKYWQGQVSGQ